MYAERILLKTDAAGQFQNLPALPPNTNVEAIFLVLGPTEPAAGAGRKVHPGIARKLQIQGNIIDTATSAEWDLPK